MASILERNGSYYIMVSGGYDSGGRQIRKTRTWKPSEGLTEKQIQKELNEQAVLFEREVRTGVVLNGEITFAEYIEKWTRDYGETQLEPKTLFTYKALFKRILPLIGHIRLDRLQPHHLIELYEKLGSEKRRVGISFLAKEDFFKIVDKKRVTQVELAKQSGVSINTVHNVFHKIPVYKTSAEKMCAVMGMQLKRGFLPANNDKLLSGKTIKHHHRLISSVLNQAVFWQIISSNPAERVRPPRVARTEANFMDEIQTGELLALIEQEPMQEKTMIKLLIYSGMRRGELCGLEWSDIDYDNHIIRIERSSQYLPDRGIYTKSPKTINSKRVIKLPAQAFVMLKEFKQWQTTQRLKMGDAWVQTNRLFTQWNGKPIHPDTVTGWFEKFIRRNGLPKISVHSLRHTNITLLIAAGIPIPTVSKRAGHANAATTTSIYAHAIRSLDEKAAEVLEDILQPNRKKVSG